MSHANRDFLPAAGLDFLLPLYDPMVKLLGADRARKKLFDQASVQPCHRVLDVGCGTGTFAVAIKGWVPSAEVVGLDPDPKALARGRRKAERAGVYIRFDQGFANALPYSDGSFDRVFSSLMFHHLPEDAKFATMREVRRVLKPGGSLHLLDLSRKDRVATIRSPVGSIRASACRATRASRFWVGCAKQVSPSRVWLTPISPSSGGLSILLHGVARNRALLAGLTIGHSCPNAR